MLVFGHEIFISKSGAVSNENNYILHKGEYLIEDLQVIEDLQKTYGRPTNMRDIYIKSDAILLIGIS